MAVTASKSYPLSIDSTRYSVVLSDLHFKTPILKPILIPKLRDDTTNKNKPLFTVRATALTNTLIIENVNIRHTQLVQALANTVCQRTVKYKTFTARLPPRSYSQS